MPGKARDAELLRLQKSAKFAASLGLEVHAGHGLDYETVSDVAAIEEMHELNIGHFLMGAALFTGLEDTIVTMKQLMQGARKA